MKDVRSTLLLVTDAWHPQVNGVVTSLDRLMKELQKMGVRVVRISPEQFVSFPCPGNSEIRLAVGARRKIRKVLNTEKIDFVHIATEGPLGFAARAICLSRGVKFTTAYHTKFPEYIEARFHIPARWLQFLMKKFHSPSHAVMVSTEGLFKDLRGEGYSNLKIWSRGVDTDLFRPRAIERSKILRSYLGDSFLSAKIFLYVGRVAAEKNIEDFLNIQYPALKIVVGDGPQKDSLKKKYPDVLFTGTLKGEKLAEFYSIADLFVFPSRTDTFGLVLLEALASGVPILAYNVCGPKDVLNGSGVGVLTHRLEEGIAQASRISRENCVRFAKKFSWEASASQFLGNLVSSELEPSPLASPLKTSSYMRREIERFRFFFR